MGAQVFYTTSKGRDAREAFDIAVDDATRAHGYEGYTGTIAEKSSFVKIHLQEGVDPVSYANELIDDYDSRIDDKWGPAGCFELGNGEFFFFGWASC